MPLTKQRALLGTADTTIPDADYPNFNLFMVGFPDPYVVHAFAWRDGQLTDLGALPGNNSSAVFEIGLVPSYWEGGHSGLVRRVIFLHFSLTADTTFVPAASAIAGARCSRAPSSLAAQLV